MKKFLILCLVIAFSMLVCPAAALGEKNTSLESQVSTKSKEEKSDGEEYIGVMASSDKSVAKIKMREYLIGCVAAETPANYHSQALRAQAVASYTYAKRAAKKNEESENSLPSGADITDDPDTHQGYLDKAARKKRWGDNFDEYERKIEEAVDEVLGVYLSYDGDYALSVYHSISSGKTLSAKSLWGSEIPYLTSVESPGDKLSPDYISEMSFTEDEFSALASEVGITVDGKAENWVENSATDDGGYVEKITLCGQTVSGLAFREAFSLKSTAFEIFFSDGVFTVTCKGHGHGMGMSQYGADYMARQGSTWREILMHYYPGTEIKS